MTGTVRGYPAEQPATVKGQKFDDSSVVLSLIPAVNVNSVPSIVCKTNSCL